MVLKQKSETNLQAALLLKGKIGDCYPVSSVHCSYYSVIQLIKYTLNKFTSISYPFQISIPKNNGIGSHHFLIKEFDNFISSNIQDYEIEKKITKDLWNLKHKREMADYSESIIGEGVANKSYNWAFDFQTNLNNSFKL